MQALTCFVPPSISDVVRMVKSSPSKQCQADPLPTWLLKESIDILAPFLTVLLSTSLRNAEVPATWKHAVVLPLLKSPGLDCAEVRNFRPVSNLPFLSKLLERVVNSQIVAHLMNNDLMPRDQSAYRRGHSTETAVLRIYNDIVEAIANGRLALMGLLDLSSAFDTVDHDILARRLELTFGLKGLTLSWLRDYLHGRTQSVCWAGSMSATRRVCCGVPQGSVLGPLLFLLYVSDIGHIVRSSGLAAHVYADDVQVLGSCLPMESEWLRHKFKECISLVQRWTADNRLSLNPGKTDLLWFSTPRRRHLISRDPITVGGVDIAISTETRLLGVLLDETLSFEGHIGNVTRICHYHLRKIRDIRRFLPTPDAIKLVRAIILARVDYCNSVLLGLPATQLRRLQSVINVACRLIFGARKYDHVTPLLRDSLHWLPISERIIYKRCWLTFRAVHDPSCPRYLSELITRHSTGDQGMKLRSSLGLQLVVPPPSKTATFGDRSFFRGNPQLWNSLPRDVTTVISPELFSKKLKTYLFSNSYFVL